MFGLKDLGLYGQDRRVRGLTASAESRDPERSRLWGIDFRGTVVGFWGFRV